MVFAGPVRPGTSASLFRRTGRSVPTGSAGVVTSRVVSGPSSVGAITNQGVSSLEQVTPAATVGQTEESVRAQTQVQTQQQQFIESVSRQTSQQEFISSVQEKARAQALREQEMLAQRIPARDQSSISTGPTGEAGLRVLTQEEVARGAPSRAFVTIRPTTTPEQAVRLGTVISQVPLVPEFRSRIQPEASLRENIKRLETATELVLKPTQTLESAQISAEKRTEAILASRPLGDIQKSRLVEVGLGGAGVLIGVGEFGVKAISSLGVQEIDLDAPKTKISLGSLAETVKAQPAGVGTFIGRAAVIGPGLVVGGTQLAGQVKAVGVVGAAKETALSFSPFQIRPGTFGLIEGAKAADLRFQVKSFKEAPVSGVTRRIIIGRAEQFPQVQVVSRQFSQPLKGKEVGVAVTDITAPVTQFRAGKFTEGIRLVRTESFFVGAAGEPEAFVGAGRLLVTKPLDGFIGGGARVFTRQTAELLVTEKEATAILTRTPFTRQQIVGGIARPGGKDILEITTGPAVKVKTTPLDSEVFVTRSTVEGIEISLPSTELTGPVTIGGTGQVQQSLRSVGTLAEATKATVTTKAISEVSVAPILPAIKPSIPTTRTIVEQEIPTTLQIPTQAVIQKLDQRIVSIDTTTSKVSSKTLQEQVPLQKFSVGSITQPRISTDVSTISAQLTSTKQGTKQKTTLQQTLVSPTVVTSTVSIRPTPQPAPTLRLPFFKLPKGAEGLPKPKKSFTVEVRRFGEFKPIARTKDLSKALELGTQRVGKTLAASFRIKGVTPSGTPAGFRRKGKVFIEKRSLRLSTIGEREEIKRAKRRKKKR